MRAAVAAAPSVAGSGEVPRSVIKGARYPRLPKPREGKRSFALHAPVATAKGDRLMGGGGPDVCRDRGFNTVFGGCEADFELTILHMNDRHSHLNPDSGDLDLA